MFEALQSAKREIGAINNACMVKAVGQYVVTSLHNRRNEAQISHKTRRENDGSFLVHECSQPFFKGGMDIETAV